MSWRKRVRVERTIDPRGGPIAGFEDRESHRTPFASAGPTFAFVIVQAHQHNPWAGALSGDPAKVCLGDWHG